MTFIRFEVLHYTNPMWLDWCDIPPLKAAKQAQKWPQAIRMRGRRTGFNGAQDDEGGICHVELGREAASDNAREAVDGQQVDDEGVAAP